MKKITLLFLCTGNACRSQMAEGWARHLSAGTIVIMSAGIEAHGKNPRAIAVMREAGIDISQQSSERITPEMLEQCDIIITVCGHADEHCPALPAGIVKNHWPLEDPARATGTDEEIMSVFRATRDEIRDRVTTLLQDIRDQAR